MLWDVSCSIGVFEDTCNCREQCSEIFYSKIDVVVENIVNTVQILSLPAFSASITTLI